MSHVIFNHGEPGHDPQRSAQRTMFSRGWCLDRPFSLLPWTAKQGKANKCFLNHPRAPSCFLLRDRVQYLPTSGRGLTSDQLRACPDGQSLLRVQGDPDGKESYQKHLLGTTFQNNVELGDPPGVPASSPSVSPSLTPPLFSALSGF